MKLNGPAFMLSNAHTVQSVLTISDAQSNITGLQFTVHGPSGTKLSKVRFGKAWSGYAPKVSYVADQASTTYVISTTVKTAKATTYAVSCQDILLNQTTSVRSTVTLAGAENTTSTTTMTG